MLLRGGGNVTDVLPCCDSLFWWTRESNVTAAAATFSARRRILRSLPLSMCETAKMQFSLAAANRADVISSVREQTLCACDSREIARPPSVGWHLLAWSALITNHPRCLRVATKITGVFYGVAVLVGARAHDVNERPANRDYYYFLSVAAFARTRSRGIFGHGK